MADFKTHITASTILGTGYGTVAHLQFGVPLGHCMIAGALCSVAGMLPDLDSKSGIPQREMLSFVSVLVPMLMMFRFQELGLSGEQMVFIAGVSYVIIRFGIGSIFRKFTKHRGMWHSIPAAAIAAMATWLICLSPEEGIRLFKAWAVFIGFILHLLLDELYSVDLMGRRLKKSWGTALKFFGKDKMANLFTYAKVGLLMTVIANDGNLMDSCRRGLDHAGIQAKQNLGIDNESQSEFGEHTADFFNGVFNHTPENKQLR